MSNSNNSGVRCELCGYRRRGSNHDAGKHHQAEVAALRSAMGKNAEGELKRFAERGHHTM